MSPKPFLEQFGYLADAPNGIAKLRELILQLAVRGKLVLQDPNDEPANVLLLEKILAEKERLVKECKAKKGKRLPAIDPSEVPFKLPQGSWAWTRLGEVTNYGFTEKAEPSDVDEQTWVLELEDVEKSTSRLVKRVTFNERRFKSSKNRFALGDVIYGKLRPYLDKVLVADGPGVCTTEMIPMGGYLGIDPAFLRWILKSPYFIAYANNTTHGMNLPRLGTENARLALIPLAPTKEQSRIVSKVDQLMALCEELEAKQNQRAETRVRLIRAAHQSLTQPRDHAEFQTAWKRIRDNFNGLHTTVDSVKALRQTILQLAVRGKLVPQDPNDEPASVLLEKIKAEKERLIAEGKSKKMKPLPSIESEDVPFDVPEGWAWARFPELGEFGRGKSKHRPRNDAVLYRGGTYPLVQTGDVARSNGSVVTYTALYNEQGLAQSRLWPKQTMCITIAANIADTGILEFDACFPDSVVGFVPSGALGNVRYFEYFMRTAKEHLLDFAPSTAQKNINLGILEAVIIPLPPVHEIKQIVAKVDQLMAQCDKLEAKIEANQTKAEHFAEAVVAELAG